MTITYENPARRLSGKIAVVTAAGQGIGRAVAERFLAEGATVYATDLRERIEELAEKLGDADKAYRFFIDRQPAGRFGTVDEIAGICMFLASADGSFITGQTVNVDGGITI